MAEVKDFARFLYEEAKIAFHPDDSFEDYVYIGSNLPVFTKAEAKSLNLRMKECFNVCRQENIDIYEFMMQFSPIHSLMPN